MRKQDITVTTPKKSLIYAVGSRPASSPRVWEDVNATYWMHTDAQYTPGYVLELTDKHAIVLVAGSHPESRKVKAPEGQEAPKVQASPLDALDYTIEDHRKQVALNEKYSHWPLSEEQKEARVEEQAELKSLPENWYVVVWPTSYVRMPWAEYDAKLSEITAQRAAEAAAKQAKQDADFAETRTGIERLAGFGLIKETEVEYWKNRSRGYSTEVSIPTSVLTTLLDGYTPKPTVSETAREVAAEL